MTEKDIADAKWALQHDVDWINLSFVRSEKDVSELELDGQIEYSKRPKICVKLKQPNRCADSIEFLRFAMGSWLPEVI